MNSHFPSHVTFVSVLTVVYSIAVVTVTQSAQTHSVGTRRAVQFHLRAVYCTVTRTIVHLPLCKNHNYDCAENLVTHRLKFERRVICTSLIVIRSNGIQYSPSVTQCRCAPEVVTVYQACIVYTGNEGRVLKLIVNTITVKISVAFQFPSNSKDFKKWEHLSRLNSLIDTNSVKYNCRCKQKRS